MSPTLRNLVVGLVTFVVVGAAAWALTRSIDPLSEDPQALPAFDEPAAVLETVPFEGDPTEFAEVLAEYERESLEAAHAAGLPSAEPENARLDAAPLAPSASEDDEMPRPTGGAQPAAVDGSSFAADPETDPTESALPGDGPTPTPTDPPSSELRAIDACAGTDTGDEDGTGTEGCPDGIAGTVLALRSFRPLNAFPEFMPAETGTGRYESSPECPAMPVEEGKAYFGVRTSRPAVITMRYRSLEWTVGEYAYPETTLVITTPDAGEEAWNDWFADAAASDVDPRAWIDHCFTLELPPRDDYVAFFSFTDKRDPEIALRGLRRVDFYVPTEGGAEPGSQRRPTGILQHGLDELYVSATHEPAQSFRTVAIPGTDTGVCSISGSASSIGRDDGAIIDGAVFGRDRVSSSIDSAITDDPAYPYFPTYTDVATDRLLLRTGTDYVVCNYWFDPGPAFNPLAVVEIEAVRVSTPQAYVPTVIVHGLTDLYRDPTEVTVGFNLCGSTTYDLSGPGAIGRDRAGARISDQTPRVLCTIDQGLGEITRRGLRMFNSVSTDVETASSSAYIRTDLGCQGRACDPNRMSEMVLVPLAEIASDGSECPSDPFTGCLTDGDHPAGKAIIELSFADNGGDRNGLDAWSIGRPAPFEDDPRELPPNPYYAIGVEYDFVAGDPRAGGVGTVTILADRPVSMEATAVTVDEGYSGPCNLPLPSLPPATMALARAHTFELSPLCLGATYRLTVRGLDEAGNVGEFINPMYGRSPDTPPDQVDIFVPLARLDTSIEVGISAPMNDLGHTVYVYPAFVRSGDTIGPITNRLGWTWPASQRERVARAGWSLFGAHGRANACGDPFARELSVWARRTSTGVPIESGAWVGLEGTNVELTVEIFENHEPGGIYSECAVDSLVQRYELNRVVSLADLLAGIEITSDDGAVTFTLETTSSGRLDY